MQEKVKKPINRWLTIAVIGMSGGVSFELAYLKYTYQPQMEAFMGLSALEIGVMLSIYATLAMIFYAPSGVIADKVNHKYLISGSLVVTGALGFLMATSPPYWVLVAINVVWAITTALLMWAATVKAVSILGTADEQGSLLGFSEGMRGLGCMIAGFISLGVYNSLGGDVGEKSFQGVLVTYGIIMCVFAVLCWFVIPDGKSAQKSAAEKRPGGSIKDILQVLKMPATWYCSFIIFGVYSIYAILSYTNSFLVDMFGMGMATATLVGILRHQVIRTLAAPVVGFLTVKSRWKSPTIWLIIGLTIIIPGLLIFILVPTSAGVLIPMIILVLLLAFCTYAGRGMYFATPGEVKTPRSIMGTTIGVMSVIGFLPDIFIYPIIGNWQDNLPAVEAYRNMWMLGAALAVVGLISAVLLFKEIKKRKQLG